MLCHDDLSCMGEARILMGHHVVERPESIWEVSPRELEGNVQGLLDQGFQFGAISDVLDGRDRLAVLTFDDAYENVYNHAFPVLGARGLRATVFLPVNSVGQTNTFDRQYPLAPVRTERIMNWKQLHELARAGWSVQSHSCSHVSLANLLLAQVEDEIRRSKAEIEDHMGLRVTSFCYPFGMLPRVAGSKLEELLRDSGYSSAVLASGGTTRTPPLNPYRIPRELLSSEPAQVIA